MFSLFDRKLVRLLTFKLEGGIGIQMRVKGIEATEGSSDWWNISLRGVLPDGLKDRTRDVEASFHTLTAQYHTGHRGGTLNFI